MLQPPPIDARLFADVTAFNRQFVQLLVATQAAGRFAMDPELVRRLRARNEAPPAQWPDCPFLLFRLVADTSVPDAVNEPAIRQDDDGVAELITLSLGFLWQLARERPHAAAIVSGAAPSWCRQLALLDIAELAGLSLGAGLQPRLIDVPGFWQDLARRRGISVLQRASLGATGLQLIMSRARRSRVAATSVLRPVPPPRV